MIDKEKYTVAYLSMEIALESNIKNYAGGLGVLAGDILRSAAEKSFPMIGMTLLSSQGYFKQKINSAGKQIEQIDRDYDFSLLKKLDTEIELNLGKEVVKIGVWQYLISRENGLKVPVYFLDSNISGNKNIYKKLTNKLYGGDIEERLRQEIILGRGGVKMLEALGFNNIKKYHLNEGHASFVGIELFSRARELNNADKIETVKRQCIFTTHTPIKTVFDEFPLPLILKNQSDFPTDLPDLIKNQKINSLDLGMYFSAHINGVSKIHQQLLNNIFPHKNISAVTNGVNSFFWTSEEFKKIYNKYFPGWREDGLKLKEAINIPNQEIWSAHQVNKQRLIDYIKNSQGTTWQAEVFTIGFARRFTEYKQPLLILSDVERLLEILETSGRAQIVFAGKAHLRDINGQEAIKKIYQIKKKYPKLNIIFLENYSLNLAQLLVAGVDLWLNTPVPPQEACGTSGMKAAHNGVAQLSTADGWWPEGYVKNKTGWLVNNADELYECLKKEVLPLYYKQPQLWQEMMKQVISINASYFNSGRVLAQYINEAYQ
jgi:starch phosphorylase